MMNTDNRLLTRESSEHIREFFFKNAGDIIHLVPAQAVQCFGVCRKCSILFLIQFSHLFLYSMGGWMPGVWGSPQNAFGYPNAMLAKPVTGWENTTLESEPVMFI